MIRRIAFADWGRLIVMGRRVSASSGAFLTFVLVDIVCPVDVQGGVRVHRDTNIPDVSVDLSRFVSEIATGYYSVCECVTTGTIRDI